MDVRFSDTYKDMSSKPADSVKRRAYIVNETTCCDTSLKEQHIIAFVVSHSRGYKEYLTVLGQTLVGKAQDTTWGAAERDYYSR